MGDGRIYTTKEVHCASCGRYRGGLGHYAATELKEEGWLQVRGMGWVCPDCLPHVAPPQREGLEEAEAFVRRVTSQVFKQKLDPATLREVARKVAESVEVPFRALTGKGGE